MSTPPLGWIAPKDRTPAQHAAHYAALSRMPKFAITGEYTDPGPVKIVLTQAWKNPAVVKDIGFEFQGFTQLTGSCVGASTGIIIACLAAVQRLIATNPTKAFVPFWPVPYGRTRLAEGDHGQGEGAMDSVMFDTLKKEGVIDINQPGLPTFDRTDGMRLTEKLEMAYSDGASALCTKWLTAEKQNPVGTAAILNNTQDVRTAIINGYPVLDGCSKFCQSGTVKGSGDKALVVGRFDGDGGHSTGFYGVWDHPDFGLMFLYGNNWARDTYPADPAGGHRCSVWLPESEVAKIWTQLDGTGEIAAVSHLTYFPAQPLLMQRWSELDPWSA